MRLGMAAGLMALALAGQPSPAHAQMDSREAIALQNQVLQLRQEVEQLRARGGAVSAPAPSARSGGAGRAADLLQKRPRQSRAGKRTAAAAATATAATTAATAAATTATTAATATAK